ncbi:exodeoxyribonuclease V subunit gamma [Vibrio sp. JC009]|uniref:exodeoxyribonuclease V subunit gamma n=1 Tax=Vibrio sp. JC009 TaxID=2912314 RepID=UPI0023B116A3|nr:exodeoxyribonuclease V subunit gamma [Vibrio sp. JC009]WED21247.1 exodeoxyribonuclease V subunit gamma [Vibrio sp. JC009]
MFTVYHSNQIDILKSLLVELIRSNPLSNPFDKELILVQSPGMSQWLKIELAKELGVAANIDFPLPATFIWDMFVQVLDDVPKRSAFNKESMAWKLMQLIPQHLEQEAFAPLKQYLQDDDDGSKLYQLSEKIADIFDGYLVYRPEWIATWEQGEAVPELGDEQPWQPVLWQALYDHTVALGQPQYHRANLYEHFIDSLTSYTHTFEGLPERLFVFGISALPPRYTDALKALGEHMDVHLMFTNPSRYYWGDVRDRKYLARLANRHRQHLELQKDHHVPKGETTQLKGSVEDNVRDELHADVVGNSLLASMGKLGRDNLYLLSQLESNEIEAFVDINRDSLLHQIQADILELEERQDDQNLDSSKHKNVISKNDHSLVLHGCHSPMREVEVLHDNLLAMFDREPELKPRDIIVMVADINAYSPAIQAVFGNAPGERYIPYSISDRTSAEESPLLSAFINILMLPESRCTSSELLELLEIPEVLKNYALDETDFERARLWVEESGIRWGLDNKTASDFGLPDAEQNHWLFGIERMLLGYAMSPESGLFEAGSGPVAPYNEVQGLDADLAGKLAHYISTIKHYRESLDRTQSFSDWQFNILNLLEDFFEVDLDGEVSLKTIRDILQRLGEQLEEARFGQEISPPVICQYFKDKLSGSRVSQRFLAGQVNFCTLMPMRSIPFKVVCLLGMNDGVYPRSMPKDGFDLMNERAIPGDRSRRDDDRYLFLEALLSAQESLYISYVGRSIQDNSERVPSILVSELIDYCAENFCFEGDESLPADDSAASVKSWLEHFHPMVPFSESAFSAEMPSYASEWLPVVNEKGQSRKPFIQPLEDIWQEADTQMELPLTELHRFWRLPVQYFFNRRLKVNFAYAAEQQEDEEPFVLNGLESYKLRDSLLETLLEARSSGESEESETERFIRHQKAVGVLPVGAFGDIEFEAGKEKAAALLQELSFITQSPAEDIEVDIQITPAGREKSCQLTGWLSGQYQAGMVRYRSGKIRSQDWLSAWIDHLCMSVSAQSKVTHLIGLDPAKGIQHQVLLPVDSVSAGVYLQHLVELYFEGMNQPLAYFPKTVLAGAEALMSGKGDEISKMEKAFNDGYNFSGEGRDSYIARVWPEWNEALSVQLLQHAQSVLLNALAHSKDIEEYMGSTEEK